ncbi:hypothetical protein WJX81_007398 [Elliptochloris bilobata]|uniref:Uncharacterized protein n=1 Tax=Elliptochloris bilobata TaxID=381761 RepID=A0AAW1RR65_9CHLO
MLAQCDEGAAPPASENVVAQHLRTGKQSDAGLADATHYLGQVLSTFYGAPPQRSPLSALDANALVEAGAAAAPAPAPEAAAALARDLARTAEAADAGHAVRDVSCERVGAGGSACQARGPAAQAAQRPAAVPTKGRCPLAGGAALPSSGPASPMPGSSPAATLELPRTQAWRAGLGTRPASAGSAGGGAAGAAATRARSLAAREASLGLPPRPGSATRSTAERTGSDIAGTSVSAASMASARAWREAHPLWDTPLAGFASSSGGYASSSAPTNPHPNPGTASGGRTPRASPSAAADAHAPARSEAPTVSPNPNPGAAAPPLPPGDAAERRAARVGQYAARRRWLVTQAGLTDPLLHSGPPSPATSAAASASSAALAPGTARAQGRAAAGGAQRGCCGSAPVGAGSRLEARLRRTLFRR